MERETRTTTVLVHRALRGRSRKPDRRLRKSSGGKSKGDRFFDIADVPPLQLVQKACESQCAADIAAGKAKITFGPSCK